jgi:hypothetical protein
MVKNHFFFFKRRKTVMKYEKNGFQSFASEVLVHHYYDVIFALNAIRASVLTVSK